MTHRDRSEYKTDSSVMAVCKPVTIPGMTGHVRRNTHMAGAGIAMHALWSVHRELAEGTLVQVLGDFRMDAEPALWLVYPKSNVLTAKVRVFIDFLLERIGNRPPWLEGEAVTPSEAD